MTIKSSYFQLNDRWSTNIILVIMRNWSADNIQSHTLQNDNEKKNNYILDTHSTEHVGQAFHVPRVSGK